MAEIGTCVSFFIIQQRIEEQGRHVEKPRHSCWKGSGFPWECMGIHR